MSPEGNTQVAEDNQIESLRLILEHEQGRPVTYEEAQDIGDSLITFFEVLAGSKDIVEEKASLGLRG
jgi:hypothetical protein